NALRFVNGKLTDMQFTQAVIPHLVMFFQVTGRMQEMFKQWHKIQAAELRPGFVATNNIPPVHQRHGALDEPVGDDDKLLAMFADNVEFLRGLAVLIFNRSEERRVGKECRSRWSTDH